MSKKTSAPQTLYVLHGWTYSTRTWTRFVTELGEKGYEVVLLAIPGLTAPLPRPFDMNEYTTWLSEVLPSSPVILMGHSFGGKLSIAFAANYPSRVKALILESSSGVVDHTLLARSKRAIFGMAAKMLSPFKDTPLRVLLYKCIGEKDYLETPNDMVRKTMANTVGVDCLPLAGRLKIPTLIVWGEHDRITPLWMGSTLASKISTSTLKVIDSARHTPHHTHTSQVTELVSQFIDTYAD